MNMLLRFFAAIITFTTLHAEVVYITNTTMDQVDRIGSSGNVTTLLSTDLAAPAGIVVDDEGNIYVANDGTGMSDGDIQMFPADGGAAVEMAASLNGPRGLAIGPDGDLFAALSGSGTVIRITAPATFTTYGTLAMGSTPQGIAFDPSGDLFVACEGTNTISKITPQGAVSVFSDEVTAPKGVVFDSTGRLFAIHGGASGEIVRFNPAGKAAIVEEGFNLPVAIGMDRTDYFYIVTASDNSLRKISPAGEVEIVADSLDSAGAIAVAGPRKSVLISKNDILSGVNSAQVSVLGEPAVASSGDVAYKVTLKSGVAGISTANAACILQNTAMSDPALIAQAGGAANGTTGALFKTFSDPVINDAGDVAFRANLTGGDATAGRTIGIFSNLGGTLDLVARQGQEISAGVKFAAFTSFAIADSSVVFLAKIAGTGVSSANNIGIWDGSLNELLRKGDTVDIGGTPVAIKNFIFLKPVPLSAGQTHHVGPDSTLAVLATLADGTHGIVRVDAGVPEAVARKNDILTDPVNAKFLKIYTPSVASGGDIAYRATMASGFGGVSSSSANAIFVDASGGGRTLIARASFPAVGTTSANFATFADPVMNNNGDVAFKATIKGGDAVSGTTAGIWSDSSGTLSLVARQGSRPPGMAAGAKFAAFKQFVLNDECGVVTLASVAGTGVTSANNLGIWAVDRDNTLQQIIRKGDKLDVNGVSKTVNGFKIFRSLAQVSGQARNYALNSDLAFLATFTDGTQSIVHVTIP